MAMLEKLVHWNGLLPPNKHFVAVTLPAGLSYAVVTADVLPDWHQPSGDVAHHLDHVWYVARRSAVLIVPSVKARLERNFVLNAYHPEFLTITVSLEKLAWWDDRLFR